jgi:hypothetical protein
MPRTHWTPSPCGRLSRPPWWLVTATTTTGPPPRPDGNSGRCACPEPTNRARRAPPGRFPRSLICRSAGPAPSCTPGTSPPLPQPGTRPRPPDGKTSGQDGPEQQPGPSIPTTHSRQFRGCCPVSGLQPLVSVSLRLSASLPHPARWRRTVARWSRAACRPTPHLRRQYCPPASPGRYGGRGRGLSPRPVIWRLVAQFPNGREGAAPGRLATADIYLCMSAEPDGEDEMRATAGFTSATRGRTH